MRGASAATLSNWSRSSSSENVLYAELLRLCDANMMRQAVVKKKSKAGRDVESSMRILLVRDKGGDPKEIAAHHGFEAMDTSELETLIEGILADHPEDWTAFVEGDPEERKKKSGFFVGQVMKMTKGQADGKVVNDILLHRAES